MPTLGRWTGGDRRSRASARRERGQVLILFVMGATVIFVIGAIVVDIGLWVSERRNAQAAADLAALAAATQLDPNNPNAVSDAQAKGLDFAQRNGYDDADPDITVTVTTPFQGEADQVQVIVDEKGGSLFAGIFGITNMDVGATAIGKYVPPQPGPGWAIFANTQNCNRGNAPLDVPAHNVRVDGATHSNANIRIRGDDNIFNGPVNWVCPNGFRDQGQGNQYQPNPFPVTYQTPPIDLTWANILPYCKFTNAVNIDDDTSLWRNNDPGTDELQSNVICSTGDLTLNHDHAHGHVTFAAQGKLTIEADNINLQPADGLPSAPIRLDQLLAFSPAPPNVASDAIEITGGGVYRGYIHAPNSEVEIDGSQSKSINGSVVANTVLIDGANTTFDASDFKGPNPPPDIHLED